MRLTKSIGFALTAAVMCVPPAFAQQATPEQPLHGYIAASGGAITNSPVEAVFSAEYDESVGQHALAYVNLSYMDNMMPSSARDALSVAATQYGLILGRTAQFTGRDRGVSVTGGGKYLFKSRGVVRPYIGGGAGVVSITRTVLDSRLGDVTQAVFTDFGVGSPSLVGPDSATKPIGEIVGGIGFVSTHTFVDAGYRYRRVFGLNQLDTYDFSQLTAGIGYRW